MVGNIGIENINPIWIDQMKRSQTDIDHMFGFKLCGDTLRKHQNDLKRISTVILHHRNIHFSMVEVFKFWRDYSRDLDANFLDLPSNKNILKIWDEYVEDWFERI